MNTNVFRMNWYLPKEKGTGGVPCKEATKGGGGLDSPVRERREGELLVEQEIGDKREKRWSAVTEKSRERSSA